MFSGKLNKYQKNYDYLVAILKSSGLDSEEKLGAYLARANKRVLCFSLIIIAIVAMMYKVKPDYLLIWSILGVLALVWSWSSVFTAHKIVKQYIREELNKESE